MCIQLTKHLLPIDCLLQRLITAACTTFTFPKNTEQPGTQSRSATHQDVTGQVWLHGTCISLHVLVRKAAVRAVTGHNMVGDGSAAPLPCGGVCHYDEVQVPVSHAACTIVADVHLKQRSHVGQAQLKLIC